MTQVVPGTSPQVVVVGAGPVGLLLACELAAARVPVVIVERLASPMTESRASQINTLTAEMLHERGFDSLLVKAARELTAHFGGLSLDLSGLDSTYAGNWKVPQYRTEAVLGKRAEQLGAMVLRGHELSDVSEFEDHVACEVDGPAGRRRIRTQYVVGCDGASSTVRRLCGFSAAQTTATRELLRADVTSLEIPGRRFERLAAGFAVAATRDGVTRVMVHERGRAPAIRKTPPEFAEVASVWARVTGDDISGGRAIWVDSFDNSRGLVSCYRRGRILVAGDAAHWHMPIGGQALNVGLQDAVNLGWKLAGAVNGWAPPDLLDSYHSERHPVAARTLRHVAAQEMLLLHGQEVEPLRDVLSELLGLSRVHDHLARAASGLDTEYAADGNPLIGRRLPNLKLRHGSGLAASSELLTGAGAVMLRISDSDEARLDGAAADAAIGGGPGIRTVRAVGVETDAFRGVRTVLLRPDGYVAWAGGDENGLKAALARWFGAALRGPL